MSDETRSELRSLFPEVEEITDEDLRDRTLRVWKDGLERGGWTVADIDRIPASLHLEALEIGLATHTRAVTHVAMSAADAYKTHYRPEIYDLNRDHILAGALLHDVGKVLEYDNVDGEWQHSASGEYVRHPFSGVALCDRNDIPPAVQEIVAFHSHEGDPYTRTPEATIVHYADFINFSPLAGDVEIA